jgi:RNA polymerase sigma-70 factor (ECF subfamily)
MMNSIKDTEVFSQFRPLLISIAYRMLGSAMDAEDIVQEAFLRWQSVPQEDVKSPKSYLCAIVTRLSIDHLRCAQVQREQYVGPWLPEPLFMDLTPGTAETALMADSVSMAFLLLLEKLSPVERAVFLLHEVFDYDYAEIASIVEKSEANCRQMVRRAHQRLETNSPDKRRFSVSPEEQQRLTLQFLQTCAEGDMDGLLAMLADQVVSYSDGGGKVSAALNPVIGPDKVARFILGLFKKAPQDTAVRFAWANGQPALVTYISGKPYSVALAELDAEKRISRLYFVVNPDKLRGAPAF